MSDKVSLRKQPKQGKEPQPKGQLGLKVATFASPSALADMFQPAGAGVLARREGPASKSQSARFMAWPTQVNKQHGGSRPLCCMHSFYQSGILVSPVLLILWRLLHKRQTPECQSWAIFCYRVAKCSAQVTWHCSIRSADIARFCLIDGAPLPLFTAP